MIYLDPKSIIKKYVRKINKAEKNRIRNEIDAITRILDDNFRQIRRKEDSVNYDKLESAYVAEYLKRQMQRDHQTRSQLKLSKNTSSDASASSLPIMPERDFSCKSTDNLNKSLYVLHDGENSISTASKSPNIAYLETKNSASSEYVNKSLQSIPEYSYRRPTMLRDNSLPNINEKRNNFRIVAESHETKAKTPDHCTSSLPIIPKERLRHIPNNKNKAMNEYYLTHVKPNFSPNPNSSKQIELTLKSYNSESKKSFRDFKIVKLFG
ncbi:hypothetical protein SteCoe_12039 [Stentor coeruleus]|uniref:Uncharacterized protein n=1 Tax=Stentor coeruleus TaxID=5963 RepID=A0A1R2CBR5_9CILI|nr:hypothetical protein SteCoe_12039 [Stentor coeruleus]